MVLCSARPASRLTPAALSFRAFDPSRAKLRHRSSICRCTSLRRSGRRWIPSTMTQLTRCRRTGDPRRRGTDRRGSPGNGPRRAGRCAVASGILLPAPTCSFRHRGHQGERSSARAAVSVGDRSFLPCRRHISKNSDGMMSGRRRRINEASEGEPRPRGISPLRKASSSADLFPSGSDALDRLHCRTAPSLRAEQHEGRPGMRMACETRGATTRLNAQLEPCPG